MRKCIFLFFIGGLAAILLLVLRGGVPLSRVSTQAQAHNTLLVPAAASLQDVLAAIDPPFEQAERALLP